MDSRKTEKIPWESRNQPDPICSLQGTGLKNLLFKKWILININNKTNVSRHPAGTEPPTELFPNIVLKVLSHLGTRSLRSLWSWDSSATMGKLTANVGIARVIQVLQPNIIQQSQRLWTRPPRFFMETLESQTVYDRVKVPTRSLGVNAGEYCELASPGSWFSHLHV